MDINKGKEGRRRTPMNDRNPKCRSMVRERGDLRRLLSSGGVRRSSGTFRSMQRPRTKQRLTTMVELQEQRREEDEEEETKGGKK